MLRLTGSHNFIEMHVDEPAALRELRGLVMRTIKTSSGTEIVLDGDLLAVIEGLFREVTARRELDRSFEDMVREIQHLIDQMTEAERRTYLAESLFLNTVKYENDRLEAYMRGLSKNSSLLTVNSPLTARSFSFGCQVRVQTVSCQLFTDVQQL
jgi:hypothetical protein